MSTIPFDAHQVLDDLPRPLYEVFWSGRTHWTEDGPWEEPYSDWREFFVYVEEVRSARSARAVLELGERIRSEGLHEDHARVLSIAVSPVHAVAESVLCDETGLEARSFVDRLLNVCPAPGWKGAWLDLLEHLMSDAPDPLLSSELVVKASDAAEKEGESREVRRMLRDARVLVSRATIAAPRPIAFRVEDMPDLLTSEFVAEILGVTPVHAHRLMSDGTVPAQKVGRQWYALREEFLKLFAPKRRRR